MISKYTYSFKYLLFQNELIPFLQQYVRMPIKLKSNTPKHILDQIKRLTQKLPLRQVHNIMACLTTAISYQLDFYLQLYQCIEEWEIDTFYWQKKIPQSKDDSPTIEHSIFKYISNIKFTNINSLFIADSDLFSLEPLSWLQIPTIKSISVSFNRITSLKPLSKCTFINMSFLNLADNHWQNHQLTHLTRLKLLPMQQKIMFGLFSTKDKLNPLVQPHQGIIDLTQLAKIQSKSVKRILYVKNQRISQKFKSTLIQRFNNPMIFN